ncbi:hypothetical protein GC207_04615 [bacterium]|nr:hypothetical protein [bacterium]
MADAPFFQLVQLKNGDWSIRSLAEGETFHPVIGPAAEAKALYVRQLKLCDRMRQEAAEFVIWDVGLGGGANALTVINQTAGAGRRVRMVSFDRTLEPLRFARQHADTLGYFGDLTCHVDQLLKSSVVNFQHGARAVHWEVKLGDFPTLMADESITDLPAPHAILFDAYSPARNAAMWTLPLFGALQRRLSENRPCVMPTYSRSTMLRTTLLLAGFFVGVGHATGEKEETTIASNDRSMIDEPLGMDWLKRARASTSAEPLVEPTYRQAPLSPASLKQLLAHPQFHPQPLPVARSGPGVDGVPAAAASDGP